MFLPCRPCCGVCGRGCSASTSTVRCSVSAADYSFTVTRTGVFSSPNPRQFQFVWYGSDFNGTIDLTTPTPLSYSGRYCGAYTSDIRLLDSICKFQIRVRAPCVDSFPGSVASCPGSLFAFNSDGANVATDVEETDLVFRCDTGVGSYDCSRVCRLGSASSPVLVSLQEAYDEYVASGTESYVVTNSTFPLNLFGSNRTPIAPPTVTGSPLITINSANYV